MSTNSNDYDNYYKFIDFYNLLDLMDEPALSKEQQKQARSLISKNPKNHVGTPVLLHALQNNEWEIVKKLINLDADCNIQDKEGKSALMYAIIANRADIVDLLLEKKANIHSKTSAGYIAMDFAIKNRNLEIIVALATKDKTLSFRAFLIAITKGDLDMVKALLPLNLKNLEKKEAGFTPLMHAASNQQFEIVKFLVTSGANLNATNTENSTMVHIAARLNKPSIVKFLTNLGADLNLRDNENHTPLMEAEVTNAEDIILFLENKLEKNLTQSEEVMTLTKLLKKKHLTKQEEIALDELLSAQVNPNVLVGPHQIPALAYALRKKNVQAAKILLAHGADKKCLSDKLMNYDETLLYFIANQIPFSNENKAVLHFLLDNNVNLETTSKNENVSYISIARHRRNTEFIKEINIYAPPTTIYLTEKKDTKNTHASNTSRKLIEAGHILGLKGTINNTDLEGNFAFESYQLFKDNLIQAMKSDSKNTSEWIQKYFSAAHSPLRETLELTIGWLKADGSISHQDFMNKHTEGKPIILPVGSAEHLFTVVIWNDVLILSNRGAAKLEEGISVFKIPDLKSINLEKFLHDVIPEQGHVSLKSLKQSMNEFVDLTQPMMVFPSKEQKHGNCSFVNLKSSMQPLLCFLELLELGRNPTPVKQFNSSFLESYLQDEALMPTLKSIVDKSRAEYKAFTNDMRNQKVNELCEEFKALPDEAEEREIYLVLFYTIILLHHGQDNQSEAQTGKSFLRKDRLQEKDRAEKLCKVMPKSDREMMLTEILFDAISEGDLNFVQWLLKMGAVITSTNDANQTPIGLAKTLGQKEILHVLVETQHNRNHARAPTLTHMLDTHLNKQKDPLKPAPEETAITIHLNKDENNPTNKKSF